MEGLTLGDGNRSILLSTRGQNAKEISPELYTFLKFIREDTPATDSMAENDFVKQLQETVREIKNNRELGQRFMYLEDLLRQERRQAEALGREQGRIEGKIEGKIESILDALEEYGDIPETIRSRILSETDPKLLRRMTKAAIHAGSLEQFEEILSHL